MKAEDKFYFGKPGQPERFDMEGACWEGYEPVGTKQKDGRTVPNCVPMKNAAGDEEKFATELKVGDRVHAGLATAGGAGVIGRLTKIEDGYAFIESEWKEKYGPQTHKAPLRLVTKMSRPGQPERFAAPSPKEQQQIRAASRPPAEAIAQLKRVVAEYKKRADKGERLDSDDYWGLKAVLDAAISGDRSGLMSRARGLDTIIREEIPQAVWHWAGGEVLRWSKPGQPEKFDASSLDRGSFAEASTSPMLGKLLAAKVMPEGGWRAVQAGSDTLVISFEDADLARDFGRRVATKGYNATSPVQAIGRYWNVEVKNGK
jgi:hypothetical protein